MTLGAGILLLMLFSKSWKTRFVFHIGDLDF